MSKKEATAVMSGPKVPPATPLITAMAKASEYKFFEFNVIPQEFDSNVLDPSEPSLIFHRRSFALRCGVLWKTWGNLGEFPQKSQSEPLLENPFHQGLRTGRDERFGPKLDGWAKSRFHRRSRELGGWPPTPRSQPHP